MVSDTKLNVVLCWHMHQPQYQDQLTGEYRLPWTYLHTIKDYVDMAAYLEINPDARAVVNFSPTLLEQISDYTQQIQGCLHNDTVPSDPLLQALASSELPQQNDLRLSLIRACLRANEQHAIKRYDAFHELVTILGDPHTIEERIIYFSDQFLADLLVWYHLAWIGETVRHGDLRIKRLIEKAHGYTHTNRITLLTVIEELVSGIIGRYRTLAETGRVELSMSPYGHPISPLLLNFNSASDAIPNVKQPDYEAYPGGEERAHWHVTEGLACFKRHFGMLPTGCWPSEGGICSDSLAILAQHGLKWAASGETVLHNSLDSEQTNGEGKHWLYHPYRAPHSDLACFFRDDGLADLIGFEYATWHADDAVANMVSHLEAIAHKMNGQPDAVVSIILDGENAWESYPHSGYHFLTALYQRLSEHPGLNLTTFRDYLEAHPPERALDTIKAGSWVYGTFSTWIGEAGKNRAWDLLCAAKEAFDKVMQTGVLSEQERRQAEIQLALCEASDWCWWFGDYNPEGAVSDFDDLYRNHLTNLYQILKVPVPEDLTDVISTGAGEPAMSGVMRRGQASA